MKNRFRDLSNGQVMGLFLLMRALEKGKKSVRLSNKCLCSILGVRAVHDKRILELASSFGPFLGECKIHAYPGHPKTATFLLPGTTEANDPLHVFDFPSFDEMEKALGLTIREIETEKQNLTVVKQSSFCT